MEMQALHRCKEEKEYRHHLQEEQTCRRRHQEIKKKNCVTAHNKTYTRPRPLHLLQVQDQEEKAFLKGHLLGPNSFHFLQIKSRIFN